MSEDRHSRASTLNSKGDPETTYTRHGGENAEHRAMSRDGLGLAARPQPAPGCGGGTGANGAFRSSRAPGSAEVSEQLPAPRRGAGAYDAASRTWRPLTDESQVITYVSPAPAQCPLRLQSSFQPANPTSSLCSHSSVTPLACPAFGEGGHRVEERHTSPDTSRRWSLLWRAPRREPVLISTPLYPHVSPTQGHGRLEG